MMKKMLVKMNMLQSRVETNINFCLIFSKRNGIRQILRGKTESSSTKEILGLDIDTCKKGIEYQFTPEVNWLKIEKDRIKSFCFLLYQKIKNC